VTNDRVYNKNTGNNSDVNTLNAVVRQTLRFCAQSSTSFVTHSSLWTAGTYPKHTTAEDDMVLPAGL